MSLDSELFHSLDRRKQLTDLVGLDVRLSIAEYLHSELGETFAPPRILQDKVAAGELGKKSGKGFYDWTER